MKKTYDGADRYSKIIQLKNIYKILKEKKVPNVDSLALAYADTAHGAVAYLKPRGVDARPKDTGEMLDAVICILEAVMVRVVDPGQPQAS